MPSCFEIQLIVPIVKIYIKKTPTSRSSELIQFKICGNHPIIAAAQFTVILKEKGKVGGKYRPVQNRTAYRF